jgi:hypothetical protein
MLSMMEKVEDERCSQNSITSQVFPTSDPACRHLAMCEGARDASKLGMVGKTIARAAGSNAAGWLGPKYGDFEEEIEKAGHLGSDGEDCNKIYICENRTQRKGVFQYILNELSRNVMEEILPFTYFKHKFG